MNEAVHQQFICFKKPTIH